MPLQARLDAAGTLHHVIVRGIEQGMSVTDWKDRGSTDGGAESRVAQAPIRAVCLRAQTSTEALWLGSRPRRVAAVRTRLGVHLVTARDLSLVAVARQLGVSTFGVAKAIARAEHQ